MAVSPHKYLVTGASGFIGDELTRQLLQIGDGVKILWRGEPDVELLASRQPAQLVFGDLNDSVSLDMACAGVDCVFHAAGLAHVQQPDRARLWQINVSGTQNLLTAAVNNGVKRLVYFSSSLAQACEQRQGDMTDYGQAKLEAEQLLLASQQKGEIEVVIIRPVAVYGERMKGSISVLISLIRNRRLPPLPKLKTEISLIGVEDLARAAILAATRPEANGNVYTVTDGERYGINEIENAIYRVLERKIPLLRSPRMLLYGAAAAAELAAKITGSAQGIGLRTYRNLTRNNCFSNQAITSDLGFQATTSLYQQLPKISQALSQQANKQ